MVNTPPRRASEHRQQHQTTDVREAYEPAVVRETVKPVQREDQTVAIERERHQEHYQTRVQPIEDRVTEKDRHESKVLPTEEVYRGHGKAEDINRKLAAEQGQYRSSQTILPTTHQAGTTSSVVAGENVHHHVHETVQPVVEREVVQPTVVHTTKPIHEKVEHTPTIHPTTVQPKMTMEEFQAAGGNLGGRGEERRVFQGEPVVRENGGAGDRKPGGLGGARGSASRE